jgi:hypothetical protein
MNFEERIYLFLNALNLFQYKYDFGNRLWKIVFPHKKSYWHKITVQQYRETYYISLVDKKVCMLEVILGKSVVANTPYPSGFGYLGEANLDKTWGTYIESAHRWLRNVQRDWIKANALMVASYPFNCRTGYVSHALVCASLPAIYRLDKKLGKKKVEKFIRIIESGYFKDSGKTVCSSMTAKRYFEYCKIAYIAAQEKQEKIDDKLSGLELYKRYADGRHEGLLDIAFDSEEEFALWLNGTHPARDRGGHPWEIKRGGNTTHIDLYVSRPSYGEKDKFIITISAYAIARLAEAIRMFLALYDAGFPITISDPEGIHRRLLNQDNIGIVPKYDSLHRANQNFPEDQDVHDVMYFDDLGRYKKRIKQFVTWKPLPMLVPKDQTS